MKLEEAITKRIYNLCNERNIAPNKLAAMAVLNDIGEAEKNFCGYAGTETVIYQPGSAKKERERRALEVCGALMRQTYARTL